MILLSSVKSFIRECLRLRVKKRKWIKFVQNQRLGHEDKKRWWHYIVLIVKLGQLLPIRCTLWVVYSKDDGLWVNIVGISKNLLDFYFRKRQTVTMTMILICLVQIVSQR